MKHLRYLTDAAMLTALVVAVLLLSHYTGAELEELFPFLIPIPVALYTSIYDWKKGLIPMFSISLISLIHNPLHGLFFVASGNVVGYIYGILLRKNVRPNLRMLVAMVGSFILNLLTIFIFSQLLYGYTFAEDLRDTLDSIIELLPTFSDEMNALLYALIEGMIPSFLILLGVVEGFVFHMATTLLSARLFKKKEHKTYQKIKFRIPRFVTFIVIPVMITSIVFLRNYLEVEGFLKILLMVGINITFILSMIYIIESLMFFATLSALLRKPWIYFLALLGVLIFPIHILIGIVDSIFPLEFLVLRAMMNQ